jgi:nicotinamide-nucleotide amidase
MNDALVLKIADLLMSSRSTLSCAESCTGGGVAYALTSVPGSSHWFELSFVTYSNQAKTALLGVEESLILQQGAVSEAVVAAMLRGLLARTGANYGVTVSGIAGPEGGTTLKPVGTVCIGWGSERHPLTHTYLFRGDRRAVREQAVTQALLNIHQFLRQQKNTV